MFSYFFPVSFRSNSSKPLNYIKQYDPNNRFRRKLESDARRKLTAKESEATNARKKRGEEEAKRKKSGQQ